MAEKIIKVGLVGFGTIGTGVAKLILEDADAIAAKTGLRLQLACVVDIDTKSPRPVKLPDGILTDDLNSLLDQLRQNPDVDVVLDFSNVGYLNSSNIAKMLKLRKVVTLNNRRKMVLCAISSHVWGLFLITGLDKLFEFADNVSVGLTAIQIDSE